MVLVASRTTRSACRSAALLGAVALLLGAARAGSAAPSPHAAVAFECTFTEPFASLWIGGGRVHGAGPDLAPTSAAVRSTSVAADGRRVTIAFAGFPAAGAKKAATGSTDRLDLTKGTAADGMSNRRWGWSVQWRRSGTTIVGACDRLDDGAVPRQVAGVASDDVLHVRASADPKATSVADAPPGSTVWRRVGAAAGPNGSWEPVAVITVKADNTTTITRGWANGRYLRTLP